jgi:hypothetical protein
MTKAKKQWRHFCTVLKHKAVVYQECRACGIGWQGLIHDLSKFSPAEFMASAMYFQGDKSPIEAEKEARDYSVAWLHHKGHNKHHWEWWTDFGPDGEIIAYKIPARYVIEMVCDWIGAGKVYGGETWTEREPWNYYHKVRAGRHFHEETEKLLLWLLFVIYAFGLEAFHRVCRERYGSFITYERKTGGR